jgi:hypothetical protein
VLARVLADCVQGGMRLTVATITAPANALVTASQAAPLYVIDRTVGLEIDDAFADDREIAGRRPCSQTDRAEKQRYANV